MECNFVGLLHALALVYQIHLVLCWFFHIYDVLNSHVEDPHADVIVKQFFYVFLRTFFFILPISIGRWVV